LLLPVKTELEAEISRFSSEGDVWLVDVKESTLLRNMDVLQNQMKRYSQMVTPAPFYPQYNEVVLVYLSNFNED